MQPIGVKKELELKDLPLIEYYQEFGYQNYLMNLRGVKRENLRPVTHL